MRMKYRLKRWKDKIEVWFRATRRRVMYHWFSRKKLLKLNALKKNEYWDMDTLLFESVFQNLVNYVEREKAGRARYFVYLYDKYIHRKITWDDLPEPARHPIIVGYHESSKWDRLVNRSKWNEVLGQFDLELEIKLKDEEPTWALTDEDKTTDFYKAEKEALTNQSNQAAEILSLYRWYKYERPNRPDPWDKAFTEPKYSHIDEQGNLTNEGFCPTPLADGNYMMRKLTPEYAEYLEKCSNLEESQTDEDTEKAIRVLKLRNTLWT